MKTNVFVSREEFIHNHKGGTNGVSYEFAEKHPDYEMQNETNSGCWDCLNCRDCDDCTRCENCIGCYMCDKCWDCTDCQQSMYLLNCILCRFCTNVRNCNLREGEKDVG